MLKLIAAGIIALVTLVGYCASEEENPVTGESQRVALTAEQEIALGVQAAPELAERYGGMEPDVAAQAAVDRIGERLVARTAASGAPARYEFHVLDDDETINAFALPGGQIFITNGLVRRLAEDELAGVLAHEVAHVVARHGAEHLAKQRLTQGLAGAATIASYDPQNPASGAGGMIAAAIGQLVTMRFSREDELEADVLAVRFLREAGYDPRAMLSLMETLSAGGGVPEFFSTHPSPENRLARIRAAIEAQGG